MKARSSLTLVALLLAVPVCGQAVDVGPQPLVTGSAEPSSVLVTDGSPVHVEPTESSTEPSPPAGAENPDTDIEFYHLDALGSVRMVTNRTGAVVARYDYLPFGEEIPVLVGGRNQVPGYGADAGARRFTGKERDSESGLHFFGARYYGASFGRFTTTDPTFNITGNLANPQRWNRYVYALNSPLGVVDPDGREPVKAQAGTIAGFVRLMNTSPHKVGLSKSLAAQENLTDFGKTSGLEPAVAGYFNNKPNRYIYTTQAGWIDMVHFLFYAGRAMQHTQEGSKTPVEDAVREGYHQELADSVKSRWSAYSYEDLPSDLAGATFAVDVFNPKSRQTLGEQVQAFLDWLGATTPTAAPNWGALPPRDSHNPPTQTNETTTPMFTTTKNPIWTWTWPPWDQSREPYD